MATSYFEIAALVLKWAPTIKRYIDIGMPVYQQLTTGGADAKGIIGVLKEAGSELFPELKDPIKQVAATATALFNTPSATEGLQRALNRLMDAGLDEDGTYGKMTKAAVLKFQEAHPPLVADGWAGPKTMAVVQTELAKLPAETA